MAARENQGLQIALIIFVVLTIILIVTTYLFFSNFQQERDKSKALTADNAKQATDKAAAVDEANAYKAAIGADSKDNKEAVLAKTKKDVETLGKGIPEANQNYRALVEHLVAELGKAHAENNDMKAKAAELLEKVKTDEAAKTAEIAAYTKKVADTASDLVKVRADFDKDRKEITKSKADLNDKFSATRKDFEDLTRKSTDQVTSLNTDNGKLTKRLQEINDQKANEQKANAIPDGKIVKVDQRQRTVWINRGTADGLRRQVSFMVYDANESNPLEANTKGKIEVVRLIEDHLAEARIVDDKLGDPMMFGDPIFSPVWEPGRVEHFALAGDMDIDHDGQNDRQRVRDLIALNGGIIDAEVADDGRKSGEMTINTKYLVLGTQPPNEGKISGYTDIRTEAQTLGVRIMKVEEFLDYMGYQVEDRTVELGKDSKPSDFKPRLPEGRQRVMPVSPSEPRRHPPVSRKVTY
jgi:uncharacterized protein YpmB